MAATLLRRTAIFVLIGLALAGVLAAQVWEVANHAYKLPVAQTGALHGWASAVGDFNGDGVDDFVVSARTWDSSSANSVGRVEAFLGATDRQPVSSWAFYFGVLDDEQAGFALAAGDFDGDGRDEIAVGRPWADVVAGTLQVDAGRVSIVQWEGGGWSVQQSLSQNDASGTSPEPNDWFGRQLEVGRFNNDAYDDLAVASYGETWGVTPASGIVHVFYGGPSGLRTDNETLVLPSVTEDFQWFGFAMAAGDFDGDDLDDLAISAPYRLISGHPHAGAVEVYSGGSVQLSTVSPQILTDTAVGTISGDEEYFGWALASANFDELELTCLIAHLPCHDDLAIGVPGQLVNGQTNAGKVVVVYGDDSGLDTTWAPALYDSAFGGVVTQDDAFGAVLTAGRLDRGGSAAYADLVIGVPDKEWQVGIENEGVVRIAFSGSSGVNGGRVPQSIHQRGGLAIGVPGINDKFGVSVAIGDFDDDGWGDLLVGAPYKDYGTTPDTGAVALLYGALFADGFESGAATFWSLP